MATIATASTLAITGFFGGYALTESAKTAAHKELNDENVPHLSNHDDKEGTLLGGGIIGFSAAVLGGFGVYFGAISRAGSSRLAYKPARKNVEQAEISI